ncbi:MAG: hypothetical protein LIP18_07105, partial [Planctomycetes bacterium]|nr:hypothetical protein [Planctomycetota bacterium]
RAGFDEVYGDETGYETASGTTWTCTDAPQSAVIPAVYTAFPVVRMRLGESQEILCGAPVAM